MTRKRSVLVTGSSGLLGSWLCEALIEGGMHVVGLDRDHRAQSRVCEPTGAMDLVTGDIEDLDLVRRAVEAYEIEFIFHLAAQALVGVAAENPIATFRSNILGTWNVLEAARLVQMAGQRLSGVIVASSDKAYGDQEKLPLSEDQPMAGRYPYDVSKSCADLIARSYFHSFNLPVCVTRCGNLYGGGDLNWSRIVPGTIRSVLSGERPIIRSDGSPVRDYIYVKDAVDALLLLSERMRDDASLYGEPYNISNDAPVSVLDIVRLILELTGRLDLSPVVLATSRLEIQKQYLSSDKIRRVLGWKPAYNLTDGLKATIAWYRAYLHLSGPAAPGELLEHGI